MSIQIGNHTFKATVPDPDGVIRIFCETNPNISFRVDLGVYSLNTEATWHFDRIMLSSSSRHYRVKYANNPSPLLSENNIASLKFTNIRNSFTIYWSNDTDSDTVVVKDVHNRTILKKTGLSIGSPELRELFIENFPVRARVNTSCPRDEYDSILEITNEQYGESIDNVTFEDINNDTGDAVDILDQIDNLILEMTREYNIDIVTLLERFSDSDSTEVEEEEIPPPYSEKASPPEYIELSPPSYNSVA